MQIKAPENTPFPYIPKVAFPHSLAFTVLGRDTKANPLVYMGELLICLITFYQ